MDFQLIEKKAAQYINNYFQENTSPAFTYHNYQHTNMVVAASQELAVHYKLDEKEKFIVMIASWFHDTGYFTEPFNHEQASASIATAFLEKEGISADILVAVTSCIMATKMPQQPKTLLEEIVCDADMYHFSCNSFSENTKALRKEIMLRCGQEISKEAWRQQTVTLLNKHRYFTVYARENWTLPKEKNLKELKAKDTEKSKIEKGKVEKPEKGVETMFRITSTNNQRLSDMADKKADILITVNSILLSAIISLLIRKLDDNQYLIIPTFIILAVTVTTMIYAILATRPRIPSGIFTQQDVDEKKVNLLFFGNFYKMNFDDYKAGMWKVMEDRDFLYGSLVKDVYSQGIVLGRKYRLLRIAYNVFMFGLIIAVLAFITAVFSIM